MDISPMYLLHLLQVQVEYNLTCVYMCGVHMDIDVHIEAESNIILNCPRSFEAESVVGLELTN